MLAPLGPDLWESRFDLVNAGVHFPGRMVVARLPGGGLWLLSPVPIDDELAAALAELGPVEHIVSPNAFHHLHFSAAAARYPDARRWLTAALAAKKPKLEHDEPLGDEAPAVWSEVFEQHLVGGMPKLDEVVFLHRPTRTLIVTDLVFNMREHEGWLSGLVFRMAGTYKRLGQSRLLRSLIRDREAAKASAEKILGWDFDRVVMAHGEVLDTDAAEQLRGAMQGML